MPPSLEEWAARLQGQPLPAMPRTIQRVTRMIDSASTTNADYQRVIGRDPGYTLAIFRHFIDHNLTPREPVTTLAHSIALLGMAPVIGATGLPRLKKPAPGGAGQGLYRCYSQACHAAWYATSWGRASGEANPEEMGIAALFHHCGEMALWTHAREEMRKIERFLANGLGADSAALAVLGFTLDQLSRELAIRWGLPPLTLEALQPFGAFKPRAIGVMLAAALARATAEDWNSGTSGELLELVAERQHLTVDGAAASVRRLSVECARNLRGLPLPVSAFHIITSATSAGNRSGDAPSAEATAAETPPTQNATPRQGRPDTGESDQPAPDKVPGQPTVSAPTQHHAAPEARLPGPAVGENTPSPLPAQPSPPIPTTPDPRPGAAIPAAVETPTQAAPSRPAVPPAPTKDERLQQSISRTFRELRESAGMDRTMFAMLTPDRKRLRARFILGAAREAPIRRFQLDVEQRHLFSLLLTKPQEFWLNEDNRDKFLPLIPEALHRTLDLRGFFVTSLFVRNRPLGILYGDCNREQGLDKDGFARFRQLSRRLCNELGAQQP